MRSEPLSLSPRAFDDASHMWSWTINAAGWNLTVEDILEPGALQASRYQIDPPCMVMIIGTDGWLWVRFVSVTDNGRMVFEQARASVSVQEDESPRFARGRRPAA